MRVKSYMNNTRNLQKRKFKKTQRKYKDVTAGGTRKTKQNKTNNRNLNKRKIKKTQRKHKVCSNQFGGDNSDDDIDFDQEQRELLAVLEEAARNRRNNAQTAENHKIKACKQKVDALHETFIARVEKMNQDYQNQGAAIKAKCDNPNKSIFSSFGWRNGGALTAKGK